MAKVAIVTDSAAEIPHDVAAAAGITVVPLIVSFGADEFRAGVDLSMDDFYARLTAPGAPFPKTAACGPGDFQAAFERLLDGGAEAVVCVTVGSRLSATHRSAELARDAMAGRAVYVVDSDSACMGEGLLALFAAESAARGDRAEDIAAAVKARVSDSRVLIALDTLEYLRRGGRISGAQAAIGSVLSVKPIITIADGLVQTLDKPRTRTRARARLLELLADRPVERAWVLHSGVPEVEAFADEVASLLGLPRSDVPVTRMGPSIAPHVGPGAVGAAVLLRST
ncbi:MAG: DegV family protein [Candidatus Limnocylindrales bacterium]